LSIKPKRNVASELPFKKYFLNTSGPQSYLIKIYFPQDLGDFIPFPAGFGTQPLRRCTYVPISQFLIQFISYRIYGLTFCLCDFLCHYFRYLFLVRIINVLCGDRDCSFQFNSKLTTDWFSLFFGPTIESRWWLRIQCHRRFWGGESWRLSA
jgi:hypothetical protein